MPIESLPDISESISQNMERILEACFSGNPIIEMGEGSFVIQPSVLFQNQIKLDGEYRGLHQRKKERRSTKRMSHSAGRRKGSQDLDLVGREMLFGIDVFGLTGTNLVKHISMEEVPSELRSQFHEQITEFMIDSQDPEANIPESINLGPEDLESPAILEKIRELPSGQKLEILETVDILAKSNIEILKKLKDPGHFLILDDFGEGEAKSLLDLDLENFLEKVKEIIDLDLFSQIKISWTESSGWRTGKGLKYVKALYKYLEDSDSINPKVLVIEQIGIPEKEGLDQKLIETISACGNSVEFVIQSYAFSGKPY